MYTLDFLTRHLFREDVGFYQGASLLAVVFLFVFLGLTRYGLSSGLAYLYLERWRQGRWAHRKIQRVRTPPRQVREEILRSVVSSLVASLFAIAWVYLYRAGYTRTYLAVGERGWGYFLLSIAVMVLTHDAYFYWTHRLFHHRKVFKWVHKAHHESTAPTAWAAWAFHPWETAVGGLYMLSVFLFLPVHPTAFFIFMGLLTLMNCYHHLGYELAPSGFSRHWLGRWICLTTHHDLHHKVFRANYGFYFSFWDTLCGTNDPRYHEVFEEVATRPSAEPALVPLTGSAASLR
jgi:Delta7-sterol 5-desaturase